MMVRMPLDGVVQTGFLGTSNTGTRYKFLPIDYLLRGNIIPDLQKGDYHILPMIHNAQNRRALPGNTLSKDGGPMIIYGMMLRRVLRLNVSRY